MPAAATTWCSRASASSRFVREVDVNYRFSSFNNIVKITTTPCHNDLVEPSKGFRCATLARAHAGGLRKTFVRRCVVRITRWELHAGLRTYCLLPVAVPTAMPLAMPTLPYPVASGLAVCYSADLDLLIIFKKVWFKTMPIRILSVLHCMRDTSLVYARIVIVGTRWHLAP